MIGKIVKQYLITKNFIHLQINPIIIVIIRKVNSILMKKVDQW